MKVQFRALSEPGGMRLPMAHDGHPNGNGTSGVQMNGTRSNGTSDRLPIEEVRAELVNTIRDNDTLIGRYHHD